jgi:hypothetical protein
MGLYRHLESDCRHFGRIAAAVIPERRSLIRDRNTLERLPLECVRKGMKRFSDKTESG